MKTLETSFLRLKDLVFAPEGQSLDGMSSVKYQEFAFDLHKSAVSHIFITFEFCN